MSDWRGDGQRTAKMLGRALVAFLSVLILVAGLLSFNTYN